MISEFPSQLSSHIIKLICELQNGHSLLHTAAMHDCVGVVALLVAQGLDVKAVDKVSYDLHHLMI